MERRPDLKPGLRESVWGSSPPLSANSIGIDMIITKPGLYRLLEGVYFRGTISIGYWPKGNIIEITQIDKDYCKVIGPTLPDWQYWDLPVEEVQ